MDTKTVKGDKALYFMYDRKKLIGMILSHVDDFGIAGTEEFLKLMAKKIYEILNVLKK